MMSVSTEVQVQEVHFVVDSGAVETVLPSNMLSHTALRKGQKFGSVYNGLEGSTVTNLGERTLTGSVGGQVSRITAQVCGITKPLYSVAQAVRAGFEVTLGRDGGGMRHRTSGRWYPFTMRNGMYEMTMSVSPGFSRPGQST